MVTGIQFRFGGQPRPAVLADGAEKPCDGTDVAAAGFRVRDGDRQLSQVGLQRRPVQRGGTGRGCQSGCQPRQPHDRDEILAQLAKPDAGPAKPKAKK